MKTLLAVIALLLAAGTASATTYTTASCSQADVAFYLNNTTSPVASGDTVVISATGSPCTYTLPITYTIPGSVTIKSASADTGCPDSCSDGVVLLDHVNHPSCFCSLFTFFTGSASSVVRLTGLTFEQDGSSIQDTNGSFVQLHGNTQNLRVDHNHFILSLAAYNNSGNQSTIVGDVDGWMYGVMDHNLFDLVINTTNNGFRVDEATMDGQTLGNGAFAEPTNFGTSQFIFFEDNTVTGGAFNDCLMGGRQVIRHNKLNATFVQEHEMADDQRGCRASEVYSNIFTGDLSTIVDGTAAVHRMGASLLWNNTTVNVPYMTTFQNDRTENPCGNHCVNTPPASWGECGVGLGPSNWDGNLNSFGYPCMDQVGRGQGVLVQGSFPQKCDPLTTNCTNHIYTGSWMGNKLEPVYEWLNQHNQVPGYGQWACSGLSQDSNTVAENRDFYCFTLIWNGTSFTTATDASGRVGTVFDGTIGTGSGLHAARPTTCHAGPGGTYGVSPTGSYGVAWWSTDTQALSVCTATNTWTENVYQPYTYPHPLTNGTAVISISPSTLLGGQVGTAYTQTLSASGGTAPYTWSVGSGTLPTSLSLNSSSGVISGTPSVANTFSFTIHVHDSTSPTQLTADMSYSVVVIPSGGGGTGGPGVNGGTTVSGGTQVSFNKLIAPTSIGHWVGVYGLEGFALPASTKSIPAWAAFNVKQGTTFSWAPVTDDGRGLEIPADGLSIVLSRAASCWYGSQVSFDIAILDGRTHQLEAYFCDWDSGGRAEVVTITDAVTGKLLDSRNLVDFRSGLYLQWSIAGHVKLNIQQVSGANAVVGGIFFS